MRLGSQRAGELFASARVARLATVSADGQPHLVPVTFAMCGQLIYTAVDGKPKRTAALRRLDNIAAESRVSVLVDHYSEDWTRLWWARADGTAEVLPVTAEAVARLAAKYPQYREQPPPGPMIAITVRRWTGWCAAS